MVFFCSAGPFPAARPVVMSRVALAKMVDTKALKIGATHAPELSATPELPAMHYVLAVIGVDSRPYLQFDEEVPRGHVAARFLFCAEGDKWGQKAKRYKEIWSPLFNFRKGEDALRVLLDGFISPPKAFSKADEAMMTFEALVKDAHDWATDMAMKTFEAWHSTENTLKTQFLKANCQGQAGQQQG